MPYRYLLFDLDGTLANTLSDIAAAVNAARLGLGLAPLPDLGVRSCIGDGLSKLLERTCPKAQQQEAKDLFCRHYGAHLLDATRAYPDIPQVLAKLRTCGIKMGVITNKPQTFTDPILKGLDLAPYFQVVLGGDSPQGRKPAAEPFHFALRALGQDPKTVAKADALIVGDGRNDILGARNAGLSACAVGWGFGAEEELRSLGPDHFIDDPNDLLGIVQNT